MIDIEIVCIKSHKKTYSTHIRQTHVQFGFGFVLEMDVCFLCCHFVLFCFEVIAVDWFQVFPMKWTIIFENSECCGCICVWKRRPNASFIVFYAYLEYLISFVWLRVRRELELGSHTVVAWFDGCTITFQLVVVVVAVVRAHRSQYKLQFFFLTQCQDSLTK